MGLIPSLPLTMCTQVTATQSCNSILAMCVHVRAQVCVHTCMRACVYHIVILYLCRDAEGVTYALEVSDRLGRTRCKEQYAFMYR